MKLSTISFPVYKLEERPPSQDGGVLFYARQYKDGRVELKVIDDTTLAGETFSKRRIQLLHMTLEGKIKLQKINTCIYFVGDLIKISKPNLWFIDSNGKPFTYTKSRLVPLVYKRINKIIPIVGGVLIEVEGILTRFKALFAPLDIHKYAALLKISPRSYILYGYSDTMQPDTVRKI